MDRCKLCGEMDKRYRQLLSTVASSTKIAIRTALLCEGPPRVYNDGKFLEEGYICRSCSRRGEKLHNLEDDLATTRQQFRDAVTTLFPTYVNAPASCGTVPVSVTPNYQVECTIPNPKRLRLESDTCDATPVKVYNSIISFILQQIERLTIHRDHESTS